MKKNSISIKETAEHIEINIKMPSVKPCINSIKQYDPNFQAQDIIKEKQYFKNTLFDHIAEYYNELLYEEIENQKIEELECKE